MGQGMALIWGIMSTWNTTPLYGSGCGFNFGDIGNYENLGTLYVSGYGFNFGNYENFESYRNFGRRDNLERTRVRISRTEFCRVYFMEFSGGNFVE